MVRTLAGKTRLSSASPTVERMVHDSAWTERPMIAPSRCSTRLLKKPDWKKRTSTMLSSGLNSIQNLRTNRHYGISYCWIRIPTWSYYRHPPFLISNNGTDYESIAVALKLLVQRIYDLCTDYSTT